MSTSAANLARTTRQYTRQAQGGTPTSGEPEVQATDPPAWRTFSAPRGGLGSGETDEDERMADVAELTGGTGTSQFGQVVADAGQISAYLERKRQKADLANFDAWVGKNFHKNDPMARKWLQETYPEYYEAREKLAVERAKFALRVFLLKLRGPKNEKDLILLWGLQTGRVRLDDGWDRIGYTFPKTETAKQQFRQDRFMSHLFGPYKYNTGKSRADYVANRLEPNNPFPTEDRGIGGLQLEGDIFARGLTQNRGISDLFSAMSL